MSQLGSQDMQPILLLVSTSDDKYDFQGIKVVKEEFTSQELRQKNQVTVKGSLNRQKHQWGSKSILNWIENNIETGRSEPQNMEKIVATDIKKNYRNTNDEYWDNVSKRLGTGNSIKPVY